MMIAYLQLTYFRKLIYFVNILLSPLNANINININFNYP